MLGFVKKMTFKTLVVLNVFTIIALLLVGYSGWINPVDHPTIATLGMGFPFVLILNIVFLVLWTFIRKRMLWLPLLGFILAYFPIRTYTPFNLPKDKPHGTIKVLSYNVFLFDTWDDIKGQTNPIADYIVRSKADIVCLQEAMIDTPDSAKMMHFFHQTYPYIDKMVKKKPGNDHLVLLSKFPILHRDTIAIPSLSNMSVAYYLDINGTETLLVNTHFESYGFNTETKNDFDKLVKGDIINSKAKTVSSLLIDKLGQTMARRAPQVDTVAAFVKKHLDKNMPVILCGDFNDTPISYSHNTINNVLTDCYVASGNGTGWSYHQNKMYFRIDHIFASDAFEAYGAKIDKSIKNSDHYPIYCWLKYRPKP